MSNRRKLFVINNCQECPKSVLHEYSNRIHLSCMAKQDENGFDMRIVDGSKKQLTMAEIADADFPDWCPLYDIEPGMYKDIDDYGTSKP